MREIDPERAEQFAVTVVQRLRDDGYEALWAGGCVRDRLLQRTPKDFDVATSATPDQIRDVFGRRRTLTIGAAFGVVTVLGPRGAGQVEVTTFRCDADYADGRHPDHVTFSTAREDAARRDFTINGIFYDPLQQQVVDYVAGAQDLAAGVVRAIGDPDLRIGEDKLRMLRAVRFAASLDFRIDESTLAAIQKRAGEISQVSAERTAAELRLMLVHSSRKRAVKLLRQSGLLLVLVPEAAGMVTDAEANSHLPPVGACDETADGTDSPWRRTLAVLDALDSPTFSAAAAAWLREITGPDGTDTEIVQQICRRWRLSNHETDRIVWLLEQNHLVRDAQQVPWPKLQRLLVSDGIGQLFVLADAIAQVDARWRKAIEYSREKLALPPDQLNPLPLITGHDLVSAGIPPGRAYAKLLETVRDAQLERTITYKQQALALVDDLWQSMKDG